MKTIEHDAFEPVLFERMAHFFKNGTEPPIRVHRWDAGLDMHACLDTPVTVYPAGVAWIDTGLKVAVPKGFAMLLVPRSGWGTRYGLTLRNTLGIIDSEYRGEIKVCLINNGYEPVTIHPNDRICQALVIPVCIFAPCFVERLEDSDRGSNGFGSSGGGQ